MSDIAQYIQFVTFRNVQTLLISELLKFPISSLSNCFHSVLCNKTILESNLVKLKAWIPIFVFNNLVLSKDVQCLLSPLVIVRCILQFFHGISNAQQPWFFLAVIRVGATHAIDMSDHWKFKRTFLVVVVLLVTPQKPPKWFVLCLLFLFFCSLLFLF
jgi:hypothetical protein